MKHLFNDCLLGTEGSLKWKQKAAAAEVVFPETVTGEHVYVLELSVLPSLVIH